MASTTEIRPDKTPRSTPLDRASDELLYAITRSPTSGLADRLAELAREIGDWDLLLTVARQHGVSPLLFTRLSESGAFIPPEPKERLKRAYFKNVFHSMANAAELISVLRAFDLERIPAMPFKGIVLGACVYRDLTARYAGDLDILIYYGDVLRATAILLKMGYELKTPVRPDGTPLGTAPFEFHFERASDGMILELRWRMELAEPRYRRDFGMDWVWPRRQIVKLAGAEVPNMDPETTLLALCMHGSKHAWSRLIWTCDVARLLNEYPGLDWRRVNREAKRWGLWRALALGVLLAHRVCLAEVPASIIRRFESDDSAFGMARHFEESLLNDPGALPKGRVPYSFKILGFRERLRLVLSLGLFQPNSRDLEFVRLPKSLHILYFFVRPLRILRDRTAR
jgi:hypothetical protein